MKHWIMKSPPEEEMKSIKLKSFGEYNIVGQSKQPLDLPPEPNANEYLP